MSSTIPAAGILGTAHAASSAPSPDSSPQTRKLYKECQQFEGILISNLWGEMEQGVSMSGSSDDPGAGTLQGLGIQSAAMGLASAGGLGIARMLYQELAPKLAHLVHPQASKSV